MMTNGGTFHHYYNRRRTTHIIATNLPDSKVKALRGDEPICHSKWITESLEAGRVLDFRQYLLYSAQSKSQPKLNFLEAATENRETPAAGPSTSAANDTSRALDSNDTNFLGEFYNNSRLHHISTMGANFKQYVSELRDKMGGGGNEGFPARKKLRTDNSKFSCFKSAVIMHIDMDCFFVSVGLRKRPELLGTAVAVAHARGAKEVSPAEVQLRKAEMEHYVQKMDGETLAANDSSNKSDLVEYSSMSELASCSYEARACGVKNGMFLGQALTLCPDLKTIPYDFEGYQEVANLLYDVVASYTLDIQAVSCDEMLVDITDVLNDCRMSDPLDFAAALRKEVCEKTQCRASVGMGPNLLLARMATRKAKPDGMFRLTLDEAKEFMREVPVRDLPGVGRMTARKLKESGVETCEDLQAVAMSDLQKEFGPKTGRTLHSFCKGSDYRTINLAQERKSVSAEVNYGIRFKTVDDCHNFLDQVSAEVASRMERLGVKGRCITLKLMVRSETAPKETSKFLGHGICDVASKSGTLSSGTRDVAVIRREVKMLNVQMAKPFEDLRGIGIQVSKLEKDSGSSGSTAGTKSMLNFVKKIDRTSRDLEAAKAKATVTAAVSSTFGCNNLSLSQIDEDVLSELPEDIRKEIEQNCQSMKKQPEPVSKCSTSKNTNNTGNARKEEAHDFSFSQLDPEVLAALPEELRAEVRQQYSRPSRPTATAFDKIMSTNQIPVEAEKSATPTKNIRGRPPKNSPNFIKRSNKVTAASVASRALFDAPETIAAVEEKKEMVEAQIEPQRTSPETLRANKASLEGAREVPEVRDLLRTWLKSTSAPTDDDIGTVAKFLRELVDEGELESVHVLLKFLLRNTASMEEWRVGCTRIVDTVQAGVVSKHGCKLYIRSN
jgi:DNA repair protein REV1